MRLIQVLTVVTLIASGCIGGNPYKDNEGNYFEPCHYDGSCNRLLTCSEDWLGHTMCMPLVNSDQCGRPGQPCCKPYEQDEHNITPPCQGPNQCLDYCFAGFRCDQSHRTGNVNVCVQD